MSEIRMLVLSEDYGESVLVLSDLSNDKLTEVLKQIESDIEDGIGRSSFEVAESLYPDCVYKEILDTGVTDCTELKELHTKSVTHYSEFTFSVVQSSMQRKEIPLEVEEEIERE